MWGSLRIGGLVDAAISNVRKIGKELEEELNEAVGGESDRGVSKSPAQDDELNANNYAHAPSDDKEEKSSTLIVAPELKEEANVEASEVAVQESEKRAIQEEDDDGATDNMLTHVQEMQKKSAPQCTEDTEIVEEVCDPMDEPYNQDGGHDAPVEANESRESEHVEVAEMLPNIYAASDVISWSADNNDIRDDIGIRCDGTPPEVQFPYPQTERSCDEISERQAEGTSPPSVPMQSNVVRESDDDIDLDGVVADDDMSDSSLLFDDDDDEWPEKRMADAKITVFTTQEGTPVKEHGCKTDSISVLSRKEPEVTPTAREHLQDDLVEHTEATCLHEKMEITRASETAPLPTGVDDSPIDSIEVKQIVCNGEQSLQCEVHRLKEEITEKEDMYQRESQSLCEVQQENERLKALLAGKEEAWKMESFELQRKYVQETQRLSDVIEQKDQSIASLNETLVQWKKSHDDKIASLTKVREECEQLRAKSQSTSNNQQKTLTAEVSKLKSLLAEKESQIEAYASEGQALSRKQGEMEKSIRKARQEVREKEAEIAKLTEINQKHQIHIDKLNECIRQNEIDLGNVNKNIAILQTVNQASADKVAKVEQELSARNVEIANLRKSLDAALSDVTKVTQEKQKLQEELDIASKRLGEGMNLANMSESQKRDLEQKEAVLRATNKHLQESLQRCMSEASSREESLKEDLRDMRKRWQEAVTHREQLASDVGESTKPLLNQISSLQDSLRQKEKHWHEIERNLSTKLQAAEDTLSTESTRRNDIEKLSVDLKEQLRVLELERDEAKEKILALNKALDEKSFLCEQLSRDIENLSAELRKEVNKVHELEEQMRSRDAIHHAEVLQLREVSSQQVSTIHQLKSEVERLSAAADNGSPRNSDSSSTKQLSGISPVPTDSSKNIFALGSDAGNVFLAGKNHQVLQRKNDEIVALRETVAQLEASRNELLIKYTALQEESLKVQNMKESVTSLKQQNEALLLLLGEKEEELEDVMSCMRDVKELYRQQIDSLISSNNSDQK